MGRLDRACASPPPKSVVRCSVDAGICLGRCLQEQSVIFEFGRLRLRNVSSARDEVPSHQHELLCGSFIEKEDAGWLCARIDAHTRDKLSSIDRLSKLVRETIYEVEVCRDLRYFDPSPRH